MTKKLKTFRRKKKAIRFACLAAASILVACLIAQVNSMMAPSESQGQVRAVSLLGQVDSDRGTVFLAEDTRGESYLVRVANNTNYFAPYAEIEFQNGAWQVRQMFPVVGLKNS